MFSGAEDASFEEGGGGRGAGLRPPTLDWHRRRYPLHRYQALPSQGQGKGQLRPGRWDNCLFKNRNPI